MFYIIGNQAINLKHVRNIEFPTQTSMVIHFADGDTQPATVTFRSLDDLNAAWGNMWKTLQNYTF